MGLDFSILLEKPYFEWLLSGLLTTLKLTGVAIAGSTALAVILIVLRMSGQRVLGSIVKAYVHFFRNTPFPVQILFWYFAFPTVLPGGVRTYLYDRNFEFIAASVALILYTSAYISEHFRSGINAIPKSQMESALSTGLTYMQSMRYIILPQAFRLSLPPLISEYLSIAKNSSVAMTIGVAEITAMSRRVESYTFRAYESFTVATSVYLILSLLTSLVLNYYNSRVLNIETRNDKPRKRRNRYALGNSNALQ
ncbi:MAG: amino acid ABC transporter permease [Firmicutes bacterium]|nr:amino acid ABC transporter permease [Bacillota bacterium]